MVTAVLAAWGAMCGTAAVAQWGGYGRGGWGMGGWASTAQQGAAEGIAQVVRSQGYANLKNSEAAKNWEDAKSKEIDNRMKWTETYFEMRKTNREARAAEEGPPVTQEQAIRLAKMTVPPRLGSTQLDPVTGHIQYPLVLQDEIFAPNRAELDGLFANRAATGGSVQFEEMRQIQDAVSKFIDVLKQNVNNYAAGDYGRARTFLDSLAHESRLPAG
ncbi:MAG: hypothetical protein EBZ74_01445 [Planctomycetia bacterium]|nr:hypothetical protein [Planctomycetia bacterium]